ncbi:head scaffolding protein [Rhizobium phage vB_RleM_P10VF]|uniref:Prohead core protein n=1 Tax=Rhizobium phage vB_RleM_P10VF TaxID=1527770 RepID=A0A076YKJ6_9CAUD|nr:head scaffolding protein [Rhizobium phage vB_RleM_P10VF]AIK68297.1 hypothetical protein P10VF_084 [Rhizobium phage vB_RleM_P10VF]
MSKIGKVSNLLKVLEAEEIEDKKDESQDAANAGDGNSVEKVLEGEGDDAVNAGDGDSVERVLEEDEKEDEDKKDEQDALTVDDDQTFVGETDDDDDILILSEADDDDDDAKNENDEEDKKDEAEDAANAGDGDSVERVLEEDDKEEEKLETLLLKFGMPAASFVEAKAILKELVESKALRLANEAEVKIKKTYAEANTKKLKRLMENVVKYSRRSAKKFVEQHEQQFVESAKFARFESFINQVNEHFVDFGMKNDPKVSMKVESLQKEIAARNKEIDRLNGVAEKLELKLEAQKISSAIKVLTEGMTVTDSERFQRIVESLEVKDYSDFLKKAQSVKTKVFSEDADKQDKKYDTFVESFVDKDKKNLGLVTENNSGSQSLLAATTKVLANK